MALAWVTEQAYLELWSASRVFLLVASRSEYVVEEPEGLDEPLANLVSCRLSPRLWTNAYLAGDHHLATLDRDSLRFTGVQVLCLSL